MKKKMFTNQVNADLLKNFKKLAIDLERPINDVLEEAMSNLLKNYEKQKSKKSYHQKNITRFRRKDFVCLKHHSSSNFLHFCSPHFV